MKEIYMSEEAVSAEERCCLDHSGDPRGAEGDHMEAVAVITLPLPDGSTVSLPVCDVCFASMVEFVQTGFTDWYLLICLDCMTRGEMTTHWLHKSDSIAEYKEMIHYVQDCPVCREFSETAKLTGHIWMDTTKVVQ